MSNRDPKKIILCLGILVILLFVLISGCDTNRTIDTTVNVKLDQTGNISEYFLTTTMSDAQYLAIKNTANSQGFSSVREYFLRDFNGASDYFDYNEPQIDSGKKIEFKNVKIIDPANTIKSISVRKENGQIFFNDSTFSSDYFFPRSYIKKMDYSLSSPIKIQKHNANSQTDDHFSVEWIYNEDQNIPVLYVITEPDSPDNVKAPGFEAIISIIVFFIFCYIHFRKPKRKLSKDD